MTEAQREFLALLKRLSDGNTPATRRNLPGADRETDRMRQACKAAGWARFGKGKFRDGLGCPSEWLLTPAGRAALAEKDKTI